MVAPYKVFMLIIIFIFIAGCVSPGGTGIQEGDYKEVHGSYIGLDEDGLAEVDVNGKIYSFVIPDELKWEFDDIIHIGDHMLVSYFENEDGQYVIQTVDCDECTICN